MSPLVVKSFDLVCLWTCFGYLLLFVSFVENRRHRHRRRVATPLASTGKRKHAPHTTHTRPLQWTETSRLGGVLKQTHVWHLLLTKPLRGLAYFLDLMRALTGKACKRKLFGKCGNLFMNEIGSRRHETVSIVLSFD